MICIPSSCMVLFSDSSLLRSLGTPRLFQSTMNFEHYAVAVSPRKCLSHPAESQSVCKWSFSFMASPKIAGQTLQTHRKTYRKEISSAATPQLDLTEFSLNRMDHLAKKVVHRVQEHPVVSSPSGTTIFSTHQNLTNAAFTGFSQADGRLSQSFA